MTSFEQVAAEVREIEPPVFPSIDRVDLATDRQVIVVTVPPGANRPYTYRGEAYRRVGATNVRMSREEYNSVLLERVHAETRWENQPAMGWAVSDLGRDELERTLDEGIRVGRIDEPAYSPAAFREALANAICHRDYSSGGSSVGVAMYDDRLEVTSSGSLHFGFTPESLFEPHESRPWNPLIASVFYRRGLIESWGQGTLRMASWAKEAGMPLPEILEVPGAVVVRFRLRTPTVSGITSGIVSGKISGKTTDKVLVMLKESPNRSIPDLAGELNTTARSIERAIRALRESGRLERIGPARGGLWKVLE